jgi:hypothetical protein
MPAHRKPTPERFCEHCGKKLERKRLPNGDLEYLIHFNRRLYCDRLCMAKAFDGRETTPREQLSYAGAHRRARKKKPPGSCERCGKPFASDVHHRNHEWTDNDPANLERICRSCHNREHRKPPPCKVCGKPQKGLGYCDKHYQRFKKYGDPLVVKVNQFSPPKRVET